MHFDSENPSSGGMMAERSLDKDFLSTVSLCVTASLWSRKDEITIYVFLANVQEVLIYLAKKIMS